MTEYMETMIEDWKEKFNGMSDSDFQSDRMEEIVNNPRHYTVGGYEAIDVIEAKLTPDEYRGWCKGNALKYLMRANYKGHHDQDCEKAQFFIKELCDVLESKECQGPVSYGNEKSVREKGSDWPF